MARTSTEDLETFLRRQEAATLADLLLELAGDHDAVRERLSRFQLADRPDRLAAAFRKRLTAWRRSTRFLIGPSTRVFGRELEAWVGEVERELLPRDPAAALDLAEAFIESDENFFERADDSDGSIGEAIRAGCRLWLEAAAKCETPVSEWLERLPRLAAGDGYGAREGLLRGADRLMDEVALRQLVARFMGELESSVAQGGSTGRLPVDAFRLSGDLSLLAEALQDPDVHVRAVLAYSPEPNEHQRERFVRDYLRHGRPNDALRWLDENWERLEDSRQRLRAEALGKLQRFDESALILRGVFERTLAVGDLRAWMKHLPEDAKAGAEARARALALDHDDPVTAALLLLEIEDDVAAEAALVAEPHRVRGEDYGRLLPLARDLEERERWVGATGAYRALLSAILERGYAKAYGHASEYLKRLREIADRCTTVAPLEPHVAFEATLKQVHGRKSSFWEKVRR